MPPPSPNMMFSCGRMCLLDNRRDKKERSILRGDQVSFKAEEGRAFCKELECVERKVEKSIRKEDSRGDSGKVKNKGGGGSP